MSVAYFDSSALVKVVLNESESDALGSAIQSYDEQVTSIVGQVEVDRAIRRQLTSEDAARASDEIYKSVSIMPLRPLITSIAGSIMPGKLRSLDAIHLATVIAMKDEIDTVFCYDKRLSEAIEELGVRVEAPA
jgi:predicted nucleic acid-binding protein